MNSKALVPTKKFTTVRVSLSVDQELVAQLKTLAADFNAREAMDDIAPDEIDWREYLRIAATIGFREYVVSRHAWLERARQRTETVSPETHTEVPHETEPAHSA